MNKMSWQTVVTVAALLSGGCLQSAPAPVVVPPAPPAVTVTEPAPPPAIPAVMAPAAEVTAPAPVAAPPVVVPEPPVMPQAAAPPAMPTPAPAADTKPVPAKPVTVTKPQPATAAAPKVVTFKASFGLVTFDHQRHAGSNACNACHPTRPPAKLALGKDKAHQLCKGCHQQKGAPTQCTDCHKKS